MLELFSGSSSAGQVYRDLGFEVISVDNDPRWNPTWVVDILSWDYRCLFRPGDFHTVVCAPPCTEFSSAKTTGPRDLDLADRLVQKGLEIIKYLAPKKGGLKIRGMGYSPREGTWHSIHTGMWITASTRIGDIRSPPEFGAVVTFWNSLFTSVIAGRAQICWEVLTQEVH